MRKISTAIILSATASIGLAQIECGGGRYTDPAFFDSVAVTLAVPFGSNTPVFGGGTETLEMDIYEPFGDTLGQRPVVLVAFGGSFVAGTRADVAELCYVLARMGYVAVAPDYRVGFFFPNINTTQLAVVRCMHDLRAAIRFLRKTVAEDGDPYRIDPDRIIVGGVSAGGIGALHVTYLDQSSEIPPTLYDDTLTIGSIEGNSGWPGYSSDVLGCWSFSGAIGDTAWIQPGDQPLCSIHETGDNVVPYGTQAVSVIGIPTGLVASGSSDIHRRMDHIDVPNCFLSYTAAQHVGYLNYDAANALAFLRDFLAGLACGSQPDCGTIFAAVHEPEVTSRVTFAPNPTDGLVVFDCPEAALMIVSDAAGREWRRDRVNRGRTSLDLGGLPSGVYQVRLIGSAVRSGLLVKK